MSRPDALEDQGEEVDAYVLPCRECVERWLTHCQPGKIGSYTHQKCNWSALDVEQRSSRRWDAVPDENVSSDTVECDACSGPPNYSLETCTQFTRPTDLNENDFEEWKVLKYFELAVILEDQDFALELKPRVEEVLVKDDLKKKGLRKEQVSAGDWRRVVSAHNEKRRLDENTCQAQEKSKEAADDLEDIIESMLQDREPIEFEGEAEDTESSSD